MNENKNVILAVVLSGLVLLAWQYFFARPEMQPRPQEPAAAQQGGMHPAPPAGGSAPAPRASPAGPAHTRRAALAAGPRVAINTPRLRGSIDLKGARIDDLSLAQYRETADPNSPPVVLLSPSGAPNAYYAEFGWTAASGTPEPVPGPDTAWKQDGSGPLGVGHPVTLTYDNGHGLIFRRTISVDGHYLFSISDQVQNRGGNAVTLYPYALISRHGTPKVLGYYLLHEGPIGVMGPDGLQQPTYKQIAEKKSETWSVTDAWLGFTDKYWAAVLVPDTNAKVNARFSATDVGGREVYQSDYLGQPQTIAPGATGDAHGRLFAGAKEVSLVGINFPFGPGGYNEKLQLNHFDLLIDWGWFYFITKPMFLALDFFFHLVGNFGLAILVVTVLVKLLFFPLANKSYVSMAKMKALQPQLAAIRERHADDKARQQQAMMELYRKERINPAAGCLPMVIQIPVFFSLYKVLFVTIEMRNAPFYGWIHDLSSPDPTNIFTLFGLVPFHPAAVPLIGAFLHLGVWPAIMGVTMWVQMKLNPAAPDPTQQVIFNWLPVVFTFMLARFPAGLVIYWAWNNTLSVIQQSVIMHRNGVRIELWENLKRTFMRTRQPAD